MSISATAPDSTCEPTVTRGDWRKTISRNPTIPKWAKLILMEHASRGSRQWHDDKTNVHALSRARLAVACGVSERTVQRATVWAVTNGWLEIASRGAKRGTKGQQQTYRYRFPRETLSAPWGTGDLSPLVVPTENTPAAEENPTTQGTWPPVVAAFEPPATATYALTLVTPELGSVTEPQEGDTYPEHIQIPLNRARTWLAEQETTVTPADEPLPMAGVPAPWPAEATPQGIRNAWHAAYAKTHTSPPDPTDVRKAMGQIGRAAKDRTNLDTWRNLWRAATEAGEAGQWNVERFLGDPPVARNQRGNHYVAQVQQDAALGLLDDILGVTTDTPRQITG